MRLLREFPAFSVLLILASALMLVPALHAAHLENWRIARTFLYHAIFFVILAIILGLALRNRTVRKAERYQLMTLLLAYLLLPVALAMPVLELQPVSFSEAYFEMLSSLTTTGATVFDRYWLVPAPIHLWRALVGWAGGLMILVAAFAVLAPLNLGGFEITRSSRDEADRRQSLQMPAARERLVRSATVIAPVYALFTGILAILLMIAGDRPFTAVCHAMSTLSTSGISPVGGLAFARSGFFGEILIAVFLLIAVSHRALAFRLSRIQGPSLRNPEIQLMLISVLGVTVVLFLRAFVGALEADRQANLLAAGQAVWGSLFTVLSHLTTAGFESRYWLTMQIWSRLEAPGIILLGVAIMGGGIATTAGGVKLLRIYALYRHGLREMDRLVHPSTPGRRGSSGNGLIAEAGTRIAFVFLMLFLVAVALVTMALAATGLSFEGSLTLAIAALTTTGPLIATLGEGTYREASDLARWILCGAMVVGRIEALAIIALFNPSYWRR